MKYVSTRDNSVKVGAAQAIAQGISRDSGLFVPEALPRLDSEKLAAMVDMTYCQRAVEILATFLTDFTRQEIEAAVSGAYSAEKFDGHPAPLAKITPDTYLLELWHGPTCAFKDMALQLLPRLMTLSAGKVAGGKEIAILVATSGDTGKAALEGFRDVEGTRILVFYPRDGVSQVQKLQMATQEGGNVGVCSVQGNFDDAQTGVKQIFTDSVLAEKMAAQNMMFSSANSINWGRLVPQIVYYVSAYCDMVKNEEIAMGDAINIAVPTGNFGNILAAWYAREMGMPFAKLICASNINNVLSDFIRTGTYDRNREFHMTASPSMDILISSNLERLLYELYGRDDRAVVDLMAGLAAEGSYTVSPSALERLTSVFYGGFCDEEGTRRTIRDTFRQQGYLCDTHTAVALAVRDAYRRETGDTTKTLVASTANPYKFAGNILYALKEEHSDKDEFVQAEELSALTKTEIPQSIRELSQKPVRFGDVCDKNGMESWVRGILGV